ncbi:glycogen debranching protein GlgX [Ancylobacter terrae]|uniref:glycogen debranching protein GlgX n=1 Tax=Ancylobacter sp. sgz301288 TaxID=3342077 RepID=UPI00385816A1
MSAFAVSSGDPEPLGLRLDGRGANVAVFSAHATRIEFCLFDAAGATEIARIALPERTGDVFHGHVAGIVPGMRYGLRAFGPWAPGEGHRFNPEKLLVDPYAVALDRPFVLHEALFDRRASGAAQDDTDSAPFVPKAIIGAAEPEGLAAPVRPSFGWGEQFIYELHVRGFTLRHPGLAQASRGTFAALADPAVLDYLVGLGVSTVELMPAMAWIDERHLPPLGLSNYWGYNPVVFGAPDPRLAPGGFAEVGAAIEALHGAGIKVLLDVVLNHTGESDVFGPTVSLRGLDNATYYRHAAGDPGLLLNDAGTGNTLALERAPVLRLGLDSLRRWAATGLDGFRFDLAATLGRRADGFDPQAPFFAAIEQDPVLRDLAMIAEPWDIGPGGYQVGNFPARWGEWNDHYRDDVRRFWRGEPGRVGALASRLAGSADLFTPRRRPLSRGINFVAAHDGFTLADLVAYAGKHNEANGEGNRDGTDANHSWNNGVEGPSDDPAIRARRRGDIAALLATLAASRGTPMLTMGDEGGRTQEGNNNAYAQDNASTWFDWEGMDRGLAAFAGRLIALRRAHPVLRGEAALTGLPPDDSGLPDVVWRMPDGGEVRWEDGETRALVAVFHAPARGEAPADGAIVALNAGEAELPLQLPPPRDGFRWRLAADSAALDGASDPSEPPAVLGPRRVLILVEEVDEDAPSRAADPALLDRLAQAAGIAPEWWDVGGTYHLVGDDTKRAILTGLGLPAGTGGEVRDSLVRLSEEKWGRAMPPALVLREGGPLRVPLGGAAALAARRLDLAITLEDGTQMALAIGAADGLREEVTRADGRRAVLRHVDLPPLPVGRHRLTLADAVCRLTLAPRSCYLPPTLAEGGRVFGVATHLYALRPDAQDQGIGDFTALGALGAAVAARGGASVGLNPLHALFPTDRERASPYHPSDRRFLDPIYIDVAALGGFEARRAVFGRLSAHGAVDYPAVWAAKRAALAEAYAAQGEDPAFAAFIAEGGEGLHRFAVFQAICEHHGVGDWRAFPPGLARPDAPEVAAFAAANASAVRFAQWLQWIADRQLAAAAARSAEAGLSLGLYRDLAVGMAPGGAEEWAGADVVMAGLAIGAPPDPLGPEGQNWNLPPPDPMALARDGYEGFARLVAANMRHAGALRIDHVMGLRRLFLLPEGAGAGEGTYLAYPFADLAGQVALESHRARCLVVGEDLGTVPAGMREQLEADRMLSYRVLWFEREGADFLPPDRYPALAAACVSTHDLPTLRGWWAGADIAEREQLGLDDAAATAAARLARATEKRRLAAALVAEGLLDPAQESAGDAEAPMSNAFFVAVHAYVARSPSILALAQLDDLAGERVAVNLPGTDRERPNWRRRLSRPIGAVLGEAPAAAALDAMARERGAR